MKSAWRAATLVTSMATGLAATACMPSFYANRLPDTPSAATFVEVDGVSLHYRRLRTAAAHAAQQPTVVLIHGYGASLESWSAIQDVLGADFDVIAFDLKGFGWSTRPDGDYSPKAHAQLVLHALAKLGVSNVVLIGHSWGSSVVMSMALLAPAQVQRVGLVSAYLYDEQVPNFFRWAQVPGIGEMLFALYYDQRVEERVPLAYHDVSYATQERVDFVEAELKRPGAIAAALATARGHHFGELALQYPRVTVPVLVLWGANDQVTPLRFGERLVKQLPDATLHVLPQCGHMPMIEARNGVVAALQAFLAPVRSTPRAAGAANADRLPAAAAGASASGEAL